MSFFNVINILSLLPHYNTIINSTFFRFNVKIFLILQIERRKSLAVLKLPPNLNGSMHSIQEGEEESEVKEGGVAKVIEPTVVPVVVEDEISFLISLRGKYYLFLYFIFIFFQNYIHYYISTIIIYNTQTYTYRLTFYTHNLYNAIFFYL